MSHNVDKRVTVCVNGRPRRLFLGLRARHALGRLLVRQIERGEATLMDGEGNRVDLDGALYDGQLLMVRPAIDAPSSSPTVTGVHLDERHDNPPANGQDRATR